MLAAYSLHDLCVSALCVIELAAGGARRAAYSLSAQGDHWTMCGKHLREARQQIKELHDDMSKRQRQTMQCMLHVIYIHRCMS